VETCWDVHWLPQLSFVEPNMWESINFVGRVENIEEDGNALLRRIGAYEDFAEGWGPYQNESLFAKSHAHHNTNAGGKNRRDYVDSEAIERRLLEYYREDYEHPVMNFTKPVSWDRLMGPPGS